jgi:hypothetical protein
MPQERQPEALAARPRLERLDSPAAEQGQGGVRPLDIAECSLCGITRPLGLLVPDGGSACADIRWYCKDAKSCTQRWTAARPRATVGAPAEESDASPDQAAG